MEEELSIDNILDEGQVVDLFEGTDLQDITEKDENEQTESEEKEKGTETTEISPEELGGSESVGSEESNKEKEGAAFDEGGSSPKDKSFYSSIANALVEDGIFRNLDKDEDLSKIRTAEDFAAFFNRQQEKDLDERQRRVDEALNVGVQPTEIQKYERIINYLDNIKDKALENEEEAGETLRKTLIYQDYVNRGFTKERAQREVERSMKAGTDIEDAKDALRSNRDYYASGYKNLIDKAKAEAAEAQRAAQEEAENLRKEILDSDTAFGDFEVSKSIRKQVFENIMKPAYKDPDTGERMTAIQKYSYDHRIEFLKNVGLLYTLTDGFTDLSKLVDGKVKKEMKKGLRELEKTINHTARTNGGALNFASGVGDPDSKFTNWDLDI